MSNPTSNSTTASSTTASSTTASSTTASSTTASSTTASSTTATDTTTSRALVRLSTVTLDMTDALELSELLDYLAQWLHHTDAHVRADLAAYAWDDGALPHVRQRLAAFARLLVCGHASFDPDDPDDPDDLDHKNDSGETEPAW